MLAPELRLVLLPALNVSAACDLSGPDERSLLNPAQGCHLLQLRDALSALGSYRVMRAEMAPAQRARPVDLLWWSQDRRQMFVPHRIGCPTFCESRKARHL
jgi:hypothetical protein